MCSPGREAKTIKDMGKNTHVVNKDKHTHTQEHTYTLEHRLCSKD